MSRRVADVDRIVGRLKVGLTEPQVLAIAGVQPEVRAKFNGRPLVDEIAVQGYYDKSNSDKYLHVVFHDGLLKSAFVEIKEVKQRLVLPEDPKPVHPKSSADSDHVPPGPDK